MECDSPKDLVSPLVPLDGISVTSLLVTSVSVTRVNNLKSYNLYA